MKNKSLSGFTLVELSFAMLLVGLFTAGLLKTQQIIAQARVKTTITKVQAIQAGVFGFRDIYTGLPGDLSDAPQRLANCRETDGCRTGDQNGRVGAAVTDIFSDDQSGLNAETTQLWRHLALADMIGEISATPQIKAWGISHPGTVFDSGFHILNMQTKNSDRTQHLLVMRGGVQGPLLRGAGFEALPSTAALMIDRALDDGLAQSGAVQANGVLCHDNGIYIPSADKNCVMFFTLNGAG